MFFSLTAGLEASVPLNGKWSVLLGLFCGIWEHVKIDGSLNAGWNTVMWVNLRTGHFVRAFFYHTVATELYNNPCKCGILSQNFSILAKVA